MNQFEERERLKMDRKLLKPQVERRRRERMNHSLENLRLLLLQGPEHQAGSQRRVEKAEILEHTVVFLQSSVTESKTLRAEDEPEGREFLHGFSACLHKAARFLQEQNETPELHHALTSSLQRRLTRCHTHTQGAQSTGRHALSHPYRIPLRQNTHPNIIRQHRERNAGAARSTTSARPDGGQSVWRPWP